MDYLCSANDLTILLSQKTHETKKLVERAPSSTSFRNFFSSPFNPSSGPLPDVSGRICGAPYLFNLAPALSVMERPSFVSLCLCVFPGLSASPAVFLMENDFSVPDDFPNIFFRRLFLLCFCFQVFCLCHSSRLIRHLRFCLFRFCLLVLRFHRRSR